MSEVGDKEVQSLLPLLRGIKRSLLFYRVGGFGFQCCCWRSWVLCEHTSTWFTARFFFISNSPVPYTLSPSSVTSGLSNLPWPSNLPIFYPFCHGRPTFIHYALCHRGHVYPLWLPHFWPCVFKCLLQSNISKHISFWLIISPHLLSPFRAVGPSWPWVFFHSIPLSSS